jgi:hypothetical protein
MVWIMLVALADGKQAQYGEYYTREYCEYRALDFEYPQVKTKCEERKVKNVS